MRYAIITAGLLLAPALASAQSGSHASAAEHGVVVQAALTAWQPGPPSLPPGARVALLEGDPAQPGPFTLRLLLPDGYRIAPHFHPAQERITVISGTFAVGAGNVFDAARLTDLTPGAYASMPAGVAHFAQARGETVIQLNNVGPWGLTYVSPADDPRGQRR